MSAGEHVDKASDVTIHIDYELVGSQRGFTPHSGRLCKGAREGSKDEDESGNSLHCWEKTITGGRYLCLPGGVNMCKIDKNTT